MRTRVKICGITRPDDAQLAAELGADAVGFVFYPPSRRAVEPTDAARIARSLPAFVSTVALFLSPEAGEVERVLKAFSPHWLQFHGEEAPAFCASFGVPYFKAVSVSRKRGLTAWEEAFADADALLVDSHNPGAPGGTGRAFDWDDIGPKSHMPLILAGGLSAANVAGAIAKLQPYGVDVSSGVESAPGVKDAQALRAFFIEVKRGDGER